MLLAVVAVGAAGTALPACSDKGPVCNGFTVNAATCGNFGPGIDAPAQDAAADAAATDARPPSDDAGDGASE